MNDEKYYLGIRVRGAARVFVLGPFSYQNAMIERERTLNPTEWNITDVPIRAGSIEEATQWVEWQLGLKVDKPIDSET